MEGSNEQLELGFPDPDDFESFDEVESDDAQAELADDSFDAAGVDETEASEGCCVR